MTITRITMMMMMMIVIMTKGFATLKLMTCSKVYLPKILFSYTGKDFNVKINSKTESKIF